MEWNIHDQILAHVDDHSGGIKFLELVTEMTKNALENGAAEDYVRALPDLIEKTVRESKDMKILEYTYRALNRQKMFVYTP